MKRIILAACLSFISLTASARNGIYIGEEIGLSWQNGMPSAAQVSATNKTAGNSFNTLRINVGYTHHLDRLQLLSFGVETAWGWYGDNLYTYAGGQSTRLSTTTLEFLFVTGLHHASSHLFLKVGGTRQSIVINGLYHQYENTVISPELGLSYGYELNPHWLLTTGYYKILSRKSTSFDQFDTNSHNLGVDAVTIGARYRF